MTDLPSTLARLERDRHTRAFADADLDAAFDALRRVQALDAVGGSIGEMRAMIATVELVRPVKKATVDIKELKTILDLAADQKAARAEVERLRPFRAEAGRLNQMHATALDRARDAEHRADQAEARATRLHERACTAEGERDALKARVRELEGENERLKRIRSEMAEAWHDYNRGELSEEEWEGTCADRLEAP